jgi:hypothetical protein
MRNDVTGAIAHAFSRWGVAGDLPRLRATWTADIDALAVRKGAVNTRASIASVKFPPPTTTVSYRLQQSAPRWSASDRSRYRIAAHRQGLQRP